MDFSTILGIVAAIGLCLYGIGFDKLGNFFDPSSIYITIGGTFAVLIACFPFRMLAKIPKHMKIIFGGNKYAPSKYIDSIVEMAQLARKNGLLALEEQANQQKDPFLKNALLLVVDAIDADKIRQMMQSSLDNIANRHEETISFYDKGMAMAPAFGMIGTLIGLINMLKSLDVSSGEASSALGEGMSVALVTTFYGSFVANVIFAPLANKLRIRNEEEILCKELILEGVLSIQSGENPKYIQEKLTSLLSESEQKKGEKKAKKGKGAEEEQPAE